MAKKYSRKAQTVALAIALPNLAMAATDAVLPTVQVSAESESPYLNESSSTKRTTSALDTAKTTQVITAETLQEQNLLSLQDALATTPGISFGAGEGGGGYGDKINMRGYDAQSNTSIDGLRDAAIQTRSDLFNYEAVEINKGANASESGVGQFSGGVNLATKAPKNRDFSNVSVGVGTDDYTRFTGDFNKMLSEDIALRLNVMKHESTYVGRQEEQQRWGIAPSLAFGMNSKTRVILSYVHQEDDNDPLYGIPFYNGKTLPGISDENNYGYRNLDDQQNTTDSTSLKIESQLARNVTLNSITRYSDIEQDMVVTAPQGTYCLSDGTKPQAITDAEPGGYGACATPGEYVPSGPRGYHRKTDTKQIANDTNVVVQFETGIVEHALVTGFTVSSEDYKLITGGYLYDSTGTSIPRPNMDVYHPDNYWHGETHYFKTAEGEGDLNVYSLYAFDTLRFSPQWLLNLGVRYDRTSGEYKNTSITNSTVTKTDQNDTLLSYNVGLTYKPVEQASLYVAYSNAQKPVQNTANSGCSETGTRANCSTDPEEAVNYELGAKWQPNDSLLLTAALFRNQQSKVRVDSASGGDQVLDGENHIDGIELGAAGNITENWGVSASLAYMQGEYGQSIADASTDTDYKKGEHMTNVPDFSGGLWTTYQISQQWKLGYGFTYQGKMYLTTPSATASKTVQSDDYLVHNASVTYNVSQDLSFQLIGKNLSGEQYYTHIRNNGWALPGEGRQAVLNVNLTF